MLKYDDGTVFADKTIEYWFKSPSVIDSSNKIMVEIHVDGRYPILAMVDTGAPWFFCKPDIADGLNLNKDNELEKITFGIRGESVQGSLYRLSVLFKTIDHKDVRLETTAFVPNDANLGDDFWKNVPFVLGYEHCLDRLNIAIKSPGQNNRGFIHLGVAEN